MKRLVIDLDHTICVPRASVGATDAFRQYAEAVPVPAVIDQLRRYRAQGFEIVIHTARNMRTFAGEIDKITTITLPLIVSWLDRHDVPYDEIIVGKPWCGTDGFYIDDRAVRPSEFVKLTLGELTALLEREKPCPAQTSS